MPHPESDDVILMDMRAEIDRYRVGGGFVPALVVGLQAGLESLSHCRNELLEAMRTEWEVMKEVSTLAFRAGRMLPLAQHKQALEEALCVFERLLDEAIAEIWMSPRPSEKTGPSGRR